MTFTSFVSHTDGSRKTISKLIANHLHLTLNSKKHPKYDPVFVCEIADGNSHFLSNLKMGKIILVFADLLPVHYFFLFGTRNRSGCSWHVIMSSIFYWIAGKTDNFGT